MIPQRVQTIRGPNVGTGIAPGGFLRKNLMKNAVIADFLGKIMNRSASDRHDVATRHAVGARLGPLSFAMPQWQNWIMARPTRLFGDWRPIDSAPLNEDVTLLVTDGRGDPYLIPYPCRRIAASGWVNSSKGNLLAVTPLQWKPYSPPRR
jgi:hypothetical protein